MEIIKQTDLKALRDEEYDKMFQERSIVSLFQTVTKLVEKVDALTARVDKLEGGVK